jgi:hypothetical protein
MTEQMHRYAELSLDGIYRYNLERRWAEGPMALFVMLNPSTADAAVDDPTIRKCIGFARRWGMGGVRVVNLYAARATDPKALRDFSDPVGPVNNTAIERAVHESPIIVAAWGANPGPLPGRIPHVKALIRAGGKDAMTLGLTKHGQPRHPLYAPYGPGLVALP